MRRTQLQALLARRSLHSPSERALKLAANAGIPSLEPKRTLHTWRQPGEHAGKEGNDHNDRPAVRERAVAAYSETCYGEDVRPEYRSPELVRVGGSQSVAPRISRDFGHRQVHATELDA